MKRFYYIKNIANVLIIITGIFASNLWASDFTTHGSQPLVVEDVSLLSNGAKQWERSFFTGEQWNSPRSFVSSLVVIAGTGTRNDFPVQEGGIGAIAYNTQVALPGVSSISIAVTDTWRWNSNGLYRSYILNSSGMSCSGTVANASTLGCSLNNLQLFNSESVGNPDVKIVSSGSVTVQLTISDVNQFKTYLSQQALMSSPLKVVLFFGSGGGNGGFSRGITLVGQGFGCRAVVTGGVIDFSEIDTQLPLSQAILKEETREHANVTCDFANTLAQKVIISMDEAPKLINQQGDIGGVIAARILGTSSDNICTENKIVEGIDYQNIQEGNNPISLTWSLCRKDISAVKAGEYEGSGVLKVSLP